MSSIKFEYLSKFNVMDIYDKIRLDSEIVHKFNNDEKNMKLWEIHIQVYSQTIYCLNIKKWFW